MTLRLVIVDYDAGNLRNVQKAFEHLGAPSIVTRDPAEVEGADAVVLPGVGAFHDGIDALERTGLDQAIRRHAGTEGKPFLGICLGMQLLARRGFEGGERAGLDLLPIDVLRLESDAHGHRLPHIGWNEVTPRPGSRLMSGIPEGSDLYFVHSYCAVPHDEPAADAVVAATATYGVPFVAAVERGLLFATQFHPEKSQRYGLRVLHNFLDACREAR